MATQVVATPEQGDGEWMCFYCRFQNTEGALLLCAKCHSRKSWDCVECKCSNENPHAMVCSICGAQRVKGHNTGGSGGGGGGGGAAAAAENTSLFDNIDEHAMDHTAPHATAGTPSRSGAHLPDSLYDAVRKSNKPHSVADSKRSASSSSSDRARPVKLARERDERSKHGRDILCCDSGSGMSSPDEGSTPTSCLSASSGTPSAKTEVKNGACEGSKDRAAGGERPFRPPSAVTDADDYLPAEMTGGNDQESDKTLQGTSSSQSLVGNPPERAKAVLVLGARSMMGDPPQNTLGSLSRRLGGLSQARSYSHLPRGKLSMNPRTSSSFSHLPTSRPSSTTSSLSSEHASFTFSRGNSAGGGNEVENVVIDAAYVSEEPSSDGDSGTSDSELGVDAASPTRISPVPVGPVISRRLPYPEDFEDDDDDDGSDFTREQTPPAAHERHVLRADSGSSSNFRSSTGVSEYTDDDDEEEDISISDTDSDDSDDYSGSVISSETEYTIERSDSDNNIYENSGKSGAPNFPYPSASSSTSLQPPGAPRNLSARTTSWNLKQTGYRSQRHAQLEGMPYQEQPQLHQESQPASGSQQPEGEEVRISRSMAARSGLIGGGAAAAAAARNYRASVARSKALSGAIDGGSGRSNNAKSQSLGGAARDSVDARQHAEAGASSVSDDGTLAHGPAAAPSTQMSKPPKNNLDDDRIRAHERHRRRKQLAAINPAVKDYFLTDTFFRYCQRRVAFSRYELDEIATFDLETKGWCIGGEILPQTARSISPIQPQYGDRVRCFVRLGIYNAENDLCTILEEINPFSDQFNPRHPNRDVDPFCENECSGDAGDVEPDDRAVNTIMRKRAVAFTVGDPAISHGLSDGITALSLGDSMHLVVTPEGFNSQCELHRGADVPAADFYVYTISLIKLEIGSDTGSGVDSSNPILAAEAKAKVDAHARVAATLANKGEDGDAEENRVRSVVPKRVSFDASKDAKSAADPQSSKQQRDSFVIGGVRVGGIVVGGIMVDDDGGIITPADGLEGLAGDDGARHDNGSPKDFRADGGNGELPEFEADQLASNPDMLQGRVSPGNSDEGGDDLGELMDEFGFPANRGAFGYGARAGRRRRPVRMQSSIEQAARSMSSGMSIGSRDTGFSGRSSISSGSSGGNADDGGLARRRRVLSGQGGLEFDRAMERAQRSKAILLQPLLSFQLDMRQFDELSGQGWAITRRWVYDAASLRFVPAADESAKSPTGSDSVPSSPESSPRLGVAASSAAVDSSTPNTAPLVPLVGHQVELRYVGYKWDPYTMGVAPVVFDKSWASSQSGPVEAVLSSPVGGGPSSVSASAASGGGGAKGADDSVDEETGAAAPRPQNFLTIVVGNGDLVIGIDRALRREHLGSIIEVAVSPSLGFGAEAFVGRDGVSVPGNSCLIFRLYVHRIYEHRGGMRRAHFAPGNILMAAGAGSRDSVVGGPGRSLRLSAVSQSEGFQRILKKLSQGEEDDAAEGGGGGKGEMVLMSGDMMFRKSFQWGRRYVVVTMRSMLIYKYDEKSGAKELGEESDREYTFSAETTIRSLRRMPRTFEFLGLVCRRRKSKKLPLKMGVVHRIFLQAPADKLQDWTHVFTVISSRTEAMRREHHNTAEGSAN